MRTHRKYSQTNTEDPFPSKKKKKSAKKCFTVSSQSGWEERALHVPADTSRIPTFPCSHFHAAIHPPPRLALNQGGPADVSSETTNMIPSTASRITDHYGTRFCNPFCSTSSLEIKASWGRVTPLQPETLSSSSPISSAPSWHHGLLPSRTQLPTAVDLNPGRGGCFFSHISVLDSRVNSIHNTGDSSHSFFWEYGRVIDFFCFL